MSQLMRSVELKMIGKEKYKGMETYKYELEPSVLQNMTENPKNEKYFTRISGTENMTSI